MVLHGSIRFEEQLLSYHCNMRGSTIFHIFFFFTFAFLAFFFITVLSVDTLTATQSLGINQTLVSPEEVFEFGFFNESSSRWYLGTWYKDIPDKIVVWVANRDTPLENSKVTLKIGDRGNLVLLNQTGYSIWSSNQTTATNPVLRLLDSGNLILIEANEKNTNNYLWQSFDYPTDTLLPGMKLGWNLDTGVEHRITSWKSQDDPSSGDAYFSLEYHGIPEVFLWNKKERVFRTGPWNGEVFGGVPILNTIAVLNDRVVANEHEVYYIPSTLNQSRLSRLVVNWTGQIQRYAWIESSQSWSKVWFAPAGDCDHYGACGPFGICDSNAFPVCKCIEGFNIKNQQQWDLRNFSDGCARKTKLECGNDKFLHKMNVQLPDTTSVFLDKNMTISECKNMCLKDCSCTAYANAEVTNGGTGCVMWNDTLLDVRQFSESGQDLFVRLAASDVGKFLSCLVVTVAIVILGVSIFILWKKRKLHSISQGNTEQNVNFDRGQTTLSPVAIFSNNIEHSDERNMDDLELPLVDFNTITMATNFFSSANKLGEGGFGSVYRGRLADGQEIAVKRLSTSSGQGSQEFKNEVRSIAKLQHRNLVRLLGCCTEKDEKMLIYEYMENNSLDSVLFDKSKSSLLHWPMRFYIICGIAKGLLYLHHDSRLKIIHRDLKASNILLDREMNPKISDFGIARIFESDQTQANTKRVVGTYGYMSPEYAMGGFFSVKSDVFSFGVLVLEIISGKKNRGFYSSDDLNLLGYAWRLWKEGSALELIESSFADSYSVSEVLRCIHVGLICVQERAEDRPTMSSVVLMLNSETASMPQPKHPGFVLGRSPSETHSSSVNQVTVTVVDGR
ncbi:receptor-like serine/threonine-protein kinase SD1-8 isoform X2 [Gastrolobium bilobum]|uniref:receptor-like serine/threonine-protein kinase SD1-8 isoform X2 n=1 Tax=Gastrolobium bilobum TaxID=150636 RepID=UPI002AB16D91|nr:receptor-like serine/threonine-protein kinase SD1-8 isoform X2 [Gastrolobium bilobum]